MKSGPPCGEGVGHRAWACLRGASSGGPGWSGWSSGRRSVGCTSSRGSRSARSIGGQGCIGTRSGGRSRARPRRSTTREAKGSKLDAFKPEIHRLLGEDCKLPGQRIRELLEPLGCTAGKTVVDDYLREVRPLFAPAPRTFQRTVYRPGELCQFDVWQPREEIPVGHGQTRTGWVVVACLGYSRAGAGALVFSKRAPDLLAGIGRCLWQLGALPSTLVWDRQGRDPRARRAPRARSSRRSCGQLKVDWRFCEPADPQAKGAVERLQGYAETNFEPGRRFANEIDFQDQLDAWFSKVNARMHKTLRARPVDRLHVEHEGHDAPA